MNAPQAKTVPTLDHWIGGAAVPPAGGQYFDDLNPLDDSLYARAADGNAADVERAVAAGCTAKMPLADMFWGDRFGMVKDPFGHVWSIASAIKKKRK